MKIDFPRFLAHFGKMDDPASFPVIVEDPFHRSEPRALINLLPEIFQEQVFKAHKARPELFGIDEDELSELSSFGERGPGSITNALRLRFWFEYDEAQAEHRRLKIVNVYSGICEDHVFYTSVLSNPEKIAWIFCRPKEYERATEEMHLFALAQLRKTLEEPIVKNGKDRPAVIAAQIKIFELLELRIKGAVVQKTMNLHASVPNKGAGLSDAAKKDEIERRIKELEQLAETNRNKTLDQSPLRSE